MEARLETMPRWLVGDWSRWVRDPLDVLRLALLGGAVVTLAVGPREQSFRMVLTFLLVLIPRALDVPRPFDLAFILGMYFQAWGNVFGAFDGIYGYDKVVHFVLPTAEAPLLYLLLVRVGVVPDLSEETGMHNRVAMVVLALAFGWTLGGGLYELYEWFADTYLGANLYTSYGDSIGDLADDAIGSLLGGVLLVAWQGAGWSSHRRRAHAGEGPREEDPVAGLGERLFERLRPGRSPHEAAPAVPPSWLPVLTLLADALRLSFLGGAAFAATEMRWEEAARFLVTFLVALVPRLLRTPRPFDLALAVAMAAQAWGDAGGAFEALTGYEQAVRLIVSTAAATTIYLALIRLRALPDLAHEARIRERLSIGLVGFSLGFSAGIAYELYIWVADRVLDAGVRVTHSQLMARLAVDGLGALLGALLLVLWSTHGWGTRAGARGRPGRAASP